MTSAVPIRPATLADWGYILTTFAKSYAEVSAYAEHTSPAVLRELLKPALEHWQTAVAVDPDDETAILGWVCHRGGVLAWLFVRPELRLVGLGSELLKHAGITPGTLIMPFAPTRLRWLRTKWDIRFRPYLQLGL